MIYAQALTEVFQNNEDPRNGTAIFLKIINRSYHSIQGYDVNCIILKIFGNIKSLALGVY